MVAPGPPPGHKNSKTELSIGERNIGQEEHSVVRNLHLVTPDSTGADASSIPTGLGDHGRSLWSTVMAEYQGDDIGGREMLFQVCAAADMAARLRAQIDKEGVLIKTKGVPREHPLIKQELAHRSFVVRGLARLGLNFEPIRTQMGRPGYA